MLAFINFPGAVHQDAWISVNHLWPTSLMGKIKGNIFKAGWMNPPVEEKEQCFKEINSLLNLGVSITLMNSEKSKSNLVQKINDMRFPFLDNAELLGELWVSRKKSF